MNNPRNRSKEFWTSALLPYTATVGQAIHNLEESQLQIILVLSADGKLVGTITDGDIRRGLLSGCDMASPIEGLMRSNPFVVTPELNYDAAARIMLANDIRHIPIINSQREVIGLHSIMRKPEPAFKRNTIVIMAGGRGKRLYPFTENCPKPMLLVAGSPMLEHIIKRAISENFINFIIATHYLGQMVENYFGDGSNLGVEINYIREDKPLGTAGALSLMSPRPELPILVINGDVLSDISLTHLLEFHTQHSARATMAVRMHEWQNPFGVVKMEGIDIVDFDEKPIFRSHINAGVYVLAPEALDEIGAGNYCDMPSLFTRLKNKHYRTIAYPIHEPWLDVGRMEELAYARENYIPPK